MAHQTVVALHLVFMVVWAAPMLVVPAILSSYGPAGPDPEARARLRTAYRALATPGLALTWLLGIVAATLVGAWDEGWLQAKLALVLALSAVHGILAGRLRRLQGWEEVPPFARAAHWVVGLLLLGAILLAVLRPL
mgnify:CR=1 FL=1